MRDDEISSGPLYMGKVVLAPPLAPYGYPVKRSSRSIPTIGDDAIRSVMDADEINYLYKTEPRRIVVNKHTHRIRYENETESEVTIVVEPR